MMQKRVSQTTHYLRRITHYPLPRQRWFQLAVILVAVLATWPVLAEPGLLNTRGGGDSPFLLQRLHQLTSALADGHFPARWMPDANYGYGYPFYNYYAPLSLYITAVFYFLGFGTIRAIHLAQLSGFLVAAWGAYQLGRTFWITPHSPPPNPHAEWVGLLTAVAYTFAPFHMVNVYVRGDSLAEFWAMAFYPWLILAVLKMVNGQWSIVNGLLALLYAALILSHNISALIFSPFLLLAILLFTITKHELQSTKVVTLRHLVTLSPPHLVTNLLPFVTSLLLALGLAAWFFVPALAEQTLAQLEPVTSGYFHYSNHFLSGNLVQSGFFFDYTVDGGNAFRMGLVQAGLALLGLVVLGWLRRDLTGFKNLSGLAFVVIGLFIATFMLTPLSRLLWDHLPLLSFTQFPWRFLSVQALFTALATGALALLPWRRWLVPLLCLLMAASGLGTLQTDHLYLTGADVTAESLAQYEWFTGNIGTTVSAEYLPHTVQPRPFTSSWLETGERHRPQILAGSVATAELVEQQATRQQWRVVVDSPAATLVLPTLHWPGWQAQVNGQPVEIRPSPGTGLIMLDLAGGSHELTVQLGHTPVRRAAELLSLLSLLLWLFWLRPWDWLHRRRRPLLASVLILVLLSAALHGRPDRPLPAGTQSWDFAQLGYLHHNPQGIAFSNGAILHGYEYSRDKLAAGEQLTIRLNLTAAPDTAVTAGLATPAHPRPQPGEVTAPLALAQQIKVDQSGDDWSTLQFDLPANIPTGLYVPYLQVGDGLALTPGTAQERGGLYLRPLRINAAAPDPAPARLDILAESAQIGARSLALHLRYDTPAPIGPNYNLSLRLVDEQGQLRQQYDLQPGHGFRPSSLWPTQQWVDDRVAAPLPDLADEAGPFFLMAWLYEVASGETAATRRLGQLVTGETGWQFVPAQPQFAELPPDLVEKTAVFHDESGPLLALRGYRVESEADGLALMLYWEALRAGAQDYTRFAHLLGPVGGPPLSQDDAMPQRGTYPTGQWQPGEMVADPVWLPLPDGAGETYEVGVGFYWAENGRFPRLAVYDEAERPLPDDIVRLELLTTD
jgi:hypothetical protein